MDKNQNFEKDLFDFINRMMNLQRLQNAIEQTMLSLKDLLEWGGLDCTLIRIGMEDFFIGFPPSFEDDLLFNDLGKMYTEETNSIHISLKMCMEEHDIIDTLIDAMYKHIPRIRQLLLGD